MIGDIDLLRPVPARNGMNVLAYVPLCPHRGSLFGYVDIHIPGPRIPLFGCAAHMQGYRRWVGLPARPWVDRDGKINYFSLAEGLSREAANAFSQAVIAALDDFAPNWRTRP
jgi:hypothetical protein